VLALATGPSGLLMLGLLSLAAVGAWRLMERKAGRLGAPVRTIRLTHQHALHVVELDGRRLVIGTGPAAAPRLVDAGPTPEIATEVTSEDAWTRS
jgi:hypothetical protein